MTMQQQVEPAILVEHADTGISRITFNRPNQRNAMNRAARVGIVKALDECRDKSKVVIITGNGPAFCAGVDLKEGQVSTGDLELDKRSDWAAVQEEIRNHPAIVIAAVNGFALGGGSTLINVSDLAIAANEASIGMPEIGFGLYPTLAGPAAQLRLSPKRAAWMVLTADRVDGATAAEWGLVNKSVPLENLDQAVTALAERIAHFDATALELSKKALWKIPGEISEWTSAIAYGTDVYAQIQARSTALAEGLGKFRDGQRNPGQG
ncbi:MULTISPECIES: enoyl-CoA hydratase/isomerase family protein [Cupriavidus]|uniref:1,4-dihydroxy-2-naphthoyl-CoA synthase n=1 Tax=Cupriavidus numazuensis TaxID=221992 RepID=A0ABM8TM43_9BURK|nr:MULTISPECIES: enoyl-CoA hydratase/isomerase family protein [Cupriavidus]MBP0623173.1 enoyl-CoA hydratase/isomerase family protein [Cupriavidus sp. LEh25]MDK2659867.1 enoyl-CoA hydratase/isomerase family protein [Cupriavidus sp. LEh21]CAG2154152.1 1,4-dihydroxy-2-naphthoyl-CoA synthase [Cupriavidus numazuensis]